jgi:hypothetical protein
MRVASAAFLLIATIANARAEHTADAYRNAMAQLFSSHEGVAGAPQEETSSTTPRLDLYSNGHDGKLYANGAPFLIKVSLRGTHASA